MTKPKTPSAKTTTPTVDPEIAVVENVETEPAFQAWARQTFDADLAGFVAKAKVYGSLDLIDVGRSVVTMGGADPRDFSDADLATRGCVFYAIGKLARIVEGYRLGLPLNADSLHDLAVYTTMARYIEANGMYSQADVGGEK